MADRNLILAGDIGGTKTHLALFSVGGEKLESQFKKIFSSKEYSGLEPVVEEFLADHRASVRRACFGIAGPVIDGRVKTPNLPWIVDAAKIARMFNLDSVDLLNDLEAAAYGVFTLEGDELLCLHPGAPRRPANRALIAAGTGLGEAIIYDDGRNYHPLASEGGHADFAPRDETEIDLLRYLIGRYGHVSYERLLSGPGLLNIYDFLKEHAGYDEPNWLKNKLSRVNDPSAVISQEGLAGKSEICVKALDMFVSIYGAEAGNLALRAKALGGLYIGGGIAPKIRTKLRDGSFMRGFADKGRYKDFLAAVPVHVILNEQTPLRGAAYYAALRCHA